MFWKAKIDRNGSKTDRLLKSVVMKSTKGKFTVRMNFADGTFTDVDMDHIPLFERGEIATVELHEDVHVPTRDTAP